MPRITAGPVPRKANHIPPPNVQRSPSVLRFSFKHLDLHNNEKFCVDKCGAGYLLKFFERVRDLSRTTTMEFKTNRSGALKTHPINFSETTERQGFGQLNEQLRDTEAWQFSISKNEHGRVHGILLDDVFYIVWIDPEHLLYAGK